MKKLAWFASLLLILTLVLPACAPTAVPTTAPAPAATEAPAETQAPEADVCQPYKAGYVEFQTNIFYDAISK